MSNKGKDSKDAKVDGRIADEDVPEPATGGAWFGDLSTPPDGENWFGTVEPAPPEE